MPPSGPKFTEAGSPLKLSFKKGRKPQADPLLKQRDSGPLSHFQDTQPPHPANKLAASPWRGNVQYKDRLFDEVKDNMDKRQASAGAKPKSKLPDFDMRYISSARDMEKERDRQLTGVRMHTMKIEDSGPGEGVLHGHHPVVITVPEKDRPKKESIIELSRKAAGEDIAGRGTEGFSMHQPSYFEDPSLEKVGGVCITRVILLILRH